MTLTDLSLSVPSPGLQAVCHQYWPSSDTQQYGQYAVSLAEESVHDGFLERVFSVTNTEAKEVTTTSKVCIYNTELAYDIVHVLC